MTVYVDALLDYPGKGKWCHMVADTLPELHALADRIGMKRAWFQNHPRHPHYDLRPSMRVKAIAAGAVALTSKEFGLMMAQKRATPPGQLHAIR